jgi:hypothetical protein
MARRLVALWPAYGSNRHSTPTEHGEQDVRRLAVWLSAVTFNPRAAALLAEKRNLTLLSNGDSLKHWGLAQFHLDVLRTSVPTTVVVSPDHADARWRHRRNLLISRRAAMGARRPIAETRSPAGSGNATKMGCSEIQEERPKFKSGQPQRSRGTGCGAKPPGRFRLLECHLPGLLRPNRQYRPRPDLSEEAAPSGEGVACLPISIGSTAMVNIEQTPAA